MLLGLFGSSAFAQDAYEFGFTVDLTMLSNSGYTVDDQSPLITDAWEQLYGVEGELNPCADLGEGSEWALLGQSVPEDVTNRNSQDFWHSNWHNGDQPKGSHYLQVMMTDDLDPQTLIMFAFTRRPADNDHTTVWLVMGTDDPDASKEECEEIAEIETPFSSNTETLLSTPFERGAFKYLRFYSEEQQGKSYGSRGYFHMSRFNIFPAVKMEEIDVAWSKLDEVYNQYYEYYDSFEGRTGTDPGDYDEATVQKFIDALDAYSALPTAPTVAQLDECRENIVATYKAIEPTKVPFTAKNLPNGYYRIKGGMMYTNDSEDVEKYMCGYFNNGKMWGIWATPELDPSDEALDEDYVQALWKITAVNDTAFDVQNMYHKGRFMPVARSTNAEMSADETYKDTLLTFDAVATNHDDEISYVNIRLAKQPANDYVYLHQGGHNSGAGVSGYLVGWCRTWSDNNGCGASEWYFEKVDDAEAEVILGRYSNDDARKKAEFTEMLNKAPGMIEIAKDVQTKYETDKPLVSDENPITSPCSDSAEGQHIEYLWDGKTDNFWHSDWHSEYTNEDHHYFQVEITDAEAYASSIFTFTRRNTTSGNQIYKWNVVGFNEDDFDLVQEDGELLAEIETPYHAGNNTESYTSAPFITTGYKYIRFYCMGTKGNDGAEAQSKFMHLAEFQVYPGEIYQSPTNQYAVLGDIAKNLEALVEEFEDYDMDAFDVADYDRLKPVYDAFVAKYVDPADLRAAIQQYKNKSDIVVVGTDPGFWPSSATADALNKTIEDAKAYDAAGAYTPAKSEEFITTLGEQAEAIDAAPNGLKEGKWYRLRFGTEAEYDKYGWSKTGNPANYWIVDDDTLGMYNAGNFGKYIAVAKRENVVLGVNDDGNDVNGSVIVPIAKEEVTLDKSIHGIDLAELTDPDMALYRFINVGDSAYAIQNKATGLFISHGGSLSVQPGLFKQHPSGYGQNAFFNKSIQGAGKSPLHLAQSQTVLCAWGNESGSGWTDADGRRGSFFVEEVADVAADYAFGDFKMSFTPGDIYGRCFPVPVTLKTPDLAQLWTVASVERTPATDEANEQVKVTLGKIESNAVSAGRPFFIIAAGEMPEDGEEYDPVVPVFNFTFNLINEPQANGYLKGVFDGKTIQQKFLTAGTGHAENALKFYDKGTSLGDNRVYITDIDEEAEPFSRKAELQVVFDENVQDGIAGVIKNVSRMGGIYTIDGRFVTNGNLNTISNMPKGAYIINGTKVIVK